MTTFRTADERYLLNLDNRENNAFAYALEVLLWLKNQEETCQIPPWFKNMDQNYLNAVTELLKIFLPAPNFPTINVNTAHELAEKIIIWRLGSNNLPANSTSEVSFEQLEQVLNGFPGNDLDFCGPYFFLTIDQIFNGLQYECQRKDYKIELEIYRRMLLRLCLVVLSLIAEICFWATRGKGAQLEKELGRALSSSGTAKALRGQFATLALAGTAFAWGEQVEFIDEKAGVKTPDFVIRRACHSLFVECTTSQINETKPNNLEQIRKSIARGWLEKSKKFSEDKYRPGLVTIDLSGSPIDRFAGVNISTGLVNRVNIPIAVGRTISIGIYDAISDFELMTHECQNHGLIAVAARALHSKIAQDNHILGIYVHYGQNIIVNAIDGAIYRPIRGILYWSGDLASEEFKMAICVAIPPVSNQIPEHIIPPIFIKLV